MRPIKFAQADIQPEDLTDIQEVLLSGWLTHGKYCKLFEQYFSSFTGLEHSIAVANCTAGLHLACLHHGIGPGDEVIVPAQTHTATAHAVEYTGARAVFADVDPLTGNILPSELEAKCTEDTRGVIIVHMAGHACDMDAIPEICARRGLFLVEDCAHALGTTWRGQHVGSYGSCGCFSFYPTKQITTGEGGMVATVSRELAEDVKVRKAFGISTPPEMRTEPGKYEVVALGYNYRMTDFQAAMGHAQLQRYPQRLEQRRANAKRYGELLEDLAGVVDFPAYNPESSYFLFQVVLGAAVDRKAMVQALTAEGIGSSIHYATPVPLMSYYRKRYGHAPEEFPNAASYGKRCLSLPVHPLLKAGDIERICRVLRTAVRP